MTLLAGGGGGFTAELVWRRSTHSQSEHGSDVNGVGVFLAQGFVFLGEEGLTFQIRGADLAKANKRAGRR